MDFSAIKDLYIGSTPVQSAWLNGSKVWERKPAVDEQSIRDAMILWYDLKRQGATNENLAADPTLRDLSGNGHDATCYNFAWTEESGISTTNYPHALVSDGVDDYAVARQLPIPTKETGYTIILKREILTFDVEGTNWVVASNRNTGNETGAFCFEKYTGKSNEPGYNRLKTLSFGTHTEVSKENPVEQITWQTSASYNGKPLTIGTSTGSPILILCGNSQDANGNNSFENSNIALYSALLFNRDLTPDEIAWVKTNLIEGNDDDADWYGVEFYTTSPNPDCIRIGNPELHKTLPVHNQMKGVLLADDGTENKLLNESDWTSETLDGSQGQVMVEMPKASYWKFETDGNIRRVKFSTKPLPGFKPTPQGYVSAYEAALQRSTNKLASVVNTDADYRGGNNSVSWDDTYRSLLGMPATKINRTNFRTYARNRKADSTEWNMMTYDMQKLLYWLFVVEYATLNTQKAFNPDKDINGYAQGGLGNGVTNLNGAVLNPFNDYNPFIPCGYTNSLGNGTGEVEFSMPEEYDSAGLTVKVPRYRGIENPFGHIWQWTDGINVRISPNEPDGDGLSKVFVCDDPSKFNDSNYDGYQHVGNEVRTNGYVKSVIFGEGGEIMPSVVGGGSTTYFCDYHYTNIPTTETLRGVLFGGTASYGADAGFAFARSGDIPSAAGAHIGSRLCFIPE